MDAVIDLYNVDKWKAEGREVRQAILFFNFDFS